MHEVPGHGQACVPRPLDAFLPLQARPHVLPEPNPQFRFEVGDILGQGPVGCRDSVALAHELVILAELLGLREDRRFVGRALAVRQRKVDGQDLQLDAVVDRPAPGVGPGELERRRREIRIDGPRRQGHHLQLPQPLGRVFLGLGPLECLGEERRSGATLEPGEAATQVQKGVELCLVARQTRFLGRADE